MSGAKRRINSTGRRKISQDQIDLRFLANSPGEPPKARIALNLQSLNLPSTAAISVEAYHRSTAMRFDCGTVGAIEVPDVLLLNELEQSGGILFRIKVVDVEGQERYSHLPIAYVLPLMAKAKVERVSFPSSTEIWGKRSGGLISMTMLARFYC